jgi:hypothetical protein
MPGSYTFFTKLLGLGEEEIHDILEDILETKKDVTTGGQAILDAKERRYLLRF